MYNRKAFKQEAKQLMQASTPHFMLVALVYVLLTTGLNYVVSWLTGGSGLLAGTLTVFLNILVALFSLVMAVGFANYALRLSRREHTGMGSLFAAFSFSGRAMGVQLLSALFMCLWALLIVFAVAIIVGVLAVVVDSIPVLIIVFVVLYIAMIVVLISVVLRYAMINFALADDPEAGAMESIRRSIRMMRGYKGKYFVLELSFIGWELLVGLIVYIVMTIGFVVSGAGLVVEGLIETVNGLGTVDDLWMIDSIVRMVEELADRLSLWSLLAEVLSLPLALWLMVYRQTAAARFYNYVSGYDYHQYMNGQQDPAPGTPLTPPDQQPAQPPAGGYYAPLAPVQEEPTEEAPQQAEQPPTPPGQGDYYNSVLPTEEPEDAAETPDESDEEEEI